MLSSFRFPLWSSCVSRARKSLYNHKYYNGIQSQHSAKFSNYAPIFSSNILWNTKKRFPCCNNEKCFSTLAKIKLPSLFFFFKIIFSNTFLLISEDDLIPKAGKKNPQPIPFNCFHKPKGWSTVQCKNNLSTVQLECIQNKMTASLKNLMLKAEMHHSWDNTSSSSCDSLTTFCCLSLSRPDYTLCLSCANQWCDEPQPNNQAEFGNIQHPLSSQRTSYNRANTALLSNWLPLSSTEFQTKYTPKPRGNANAGASNEPSGQHPSHLRPTL